VTIKEISRDQVDALFNTIPKSAIFTATFIKVDKTVRKINGRRGVKCALAHPNTIGAGLYKIKSDKQKKYIIVYDMHKKGYRNMSKERLLSVRSSGVEYRIVD
jgi:hypothetical protein